MNDDSRMAQKLAAIMPYLNEKQRRLLLALEAEALGHGGISRVSRASGVSRVTIQKALQEKELSSPQDNRVRRLGGGRKKKREQDASLLTDLELLISPSTRGDPMSPLRWSEHLVRELLYEADYSLQANAKTLEGSRHPDRDAQFQYLNDQTRSFMAQELPVVSVDTKKKELVGSFKNNGQAWQPKGQPEAVNVHDFPDPRLGKAIPYGIYDVGRNEGWVTVGQDHDTASFAVASLQRWWESIGQPRYPKAQQLLICADGGGNNGYRVRLWKVEIQRLANATGLSITVCHLPPGTSKWNKIEHRLFSHISMNWRGRPLVSHEVVVDLISATTTRTGLQVQAELDTHLYPTKIKVSDEDLAAVQLIPHDFHGEWNYTIAPLSVSADL
jgi:Rhodopirellula transposase DDE domain